MAPLYLLLTLSGFLQPADTVDISRPVAVIFEGDTVVLEEDRFNWDSLARVYLKPMLEAGCAFASIRIENSLLRNDTLFLTTVVDSGQMVGVASLAFHGTHYTRPGLLSRLSGFMPFIFSLDRIAELAVNLEGKNCSVMDWEVVLIPNANPVPVWETYNESGDSIQPVILNLLVSEDRIPSRVQAAAGYADEEGFTGEADILIANPFGGRREIAFTWRRFQSHDLSYSLSLRDPYIFHLPFGAGIAGSFRSFDSTSYHFLAGAEVFFEVGSGEAGLGYAYEGTRTDTINIRKNLATTRLEAGPLRLNLKAGERRTLESAVYFNADAGVTVTLPIFWLFSFHTEPSAGLVSSTDSLVDAELIPVGGARSIRGYAEEEFRSLWVISSRQELRWGSEQFYIYPLADIGWIADEGPAAGYGLGLSVATPVGLLKLDAALPWDGAWNQAKLHLSLGVDF